MEQNISTAQREYYKRPKDERFQSLEALVENAQEDKDNSAERNYNIRDLKAIVTESPDGGENLRVSSPTGVARFTHYSFGQTCRALKMPANYLRTLPVGLAADCMNFGIDASPVGTTANILVRGSSFIPTIRAWTSETYGRAWDADLYGTVKETFKHDSAWKLPLNWDNVPDGAYRGDRDSSLLLINGGSIVEDKSLTSAGKDGRIFRGVLIRNSEVGQSSVFIDRIMYRYVCGNMQLWGAIYDKRFRRRHVGTNVVRDVIREITTTAQEWTTSDIGQEQRIIDAITSHQLAFTKEGVIDELQKIGFTKKVATDAYERCEQTEPISPFTTWGIVQGLTRLSQDSGYQDQRVALDLQAAKLANRAVEVVA